MRAARRVREVRQFAQSECGLCSIAMVLSAYGSRNSVTALRRAYETGRDGLSIRDIVTILREHGMRVRTFRGSVARLTELAFPLIAYWDSSHMVVVERLTTGSAMVVDPAGGRRRYSLDEFKRHYSGLVVEAVPDSGYRPVRHREPSVWWEFLRALGRARRAMAVVVAMSLMLYSFTLLMPLTIQYAINRFAGFFAETQLAVAILLVTAPMGAFAAVSILRAVCLASVIRRLGEAMMNRTFRKLLSLPYKFFATRSQGELMYRLSSVSAVRDMISSQAPAVVLDLGTLVVALSYVFARSVALGLLTLGLLLCMATIAVAMYRPIRKVIDREISETADSTTKQLEALSSIEILKVSGMTGSFFNDWSAVYARVLRHTQRRIVLQGASTSGYATFQMFGPLIVLVVGLWLVYGGSLDLGSAVAVQALTATSLGMVMSLSSSFTQLIVAHAQVSRLGDILHQPPARGVFGSTPVRIRGGISLRNVGFAYPGARAPVLEGVSFDVRPGQRVAIVGATGSGKSTLGKLLMGLYPVSAGEIQYDGVPMQEISAESFYRSVSYVPQETILSNRAIADNITFGAPDAEPDTMLEAARRARIHDEVAAMPLGFQTQVREMGGSLSGGQRQRIALARALARQPRVLVLDEATSSLDTMTESMITKVLSDLECTQVIIAHRLSTIVNADLIVVLQEGTVVQAGRHDELVAAPGPYRGLVASQVDVR